MDIWVKGTEVYFNQVMHEIPYGKLVHIVIADGKLCIDGKEVEDNDGYLEGTVDDVTVKALAELDKGE